MARHRQALPGRALAGVLVAWLGVCLGACARTSSAGAPGASVDETASPEAYRAKVDTLERERCGCTTAECNADVTDRLGLVFEAGMARHGEYLFLGRPDVSSCEPDPSHEAFMAVTKIYDGARAFFFDPEGGSRANLPLPGAGPTPPLGACCGSGGTCAPDEDLWDRDPWRALRFSMDDPHRYSVEYRVQGGVLRIRAFGDLDCDGIYSTFEIRDEVKSLRPWGQGRPRMTWHLAGE